MDISVRSGYKLVICAICVFMYAIHVKSEYKSTSACYNANAACNRYSLDCPDGDIIRPISSKYGLKNYTCRGGKNNCFRDTDGCCTYSDTDCMEYWTQFHTYNLYTKCSGKEQCGPLQSPFNVLSSCNNNPSKYIHIEYQCTPQTQVVHFCDDLQLSGSEVNMVFNRETDVFDNKTDCSCFVNAPSKSINVHVVDVRLMDEETSGNGQTSCSSSTVSNLPGGELTITCSESLPEEQNFYNNYPVTFDSRFIELKVMNLYKNGPTDAPANIWLSVTGSGGEELDVTCFKHVPGLTTLPPTQTPPTSTDEGLGDDDNDGNTGAIVAGVLVPIIILAIVGAVVAFFIWKRKRKPAKKERAHANNYEDEIGTVYDEIEFVPEAAANPEYGQGQVTTGSNMTKGKDTSKPETGNTHVNGHTYINVESKSRNSAAKESKGRFGLIKSKADKFISYFRKPTQASEAPTSKRGREDSGVSYDHIRPISAVSVHVTPPSDDSGHVYSHTKDMSGTNQSKPIDIPNVNNTPEFPEDINAVHVGDSYIEFQSGANKDDPNLIKMNDTEKNAPKGRPEPPTRPPPSPVVMSRDINSASPNVTRPKSPNNLFPNAKDAFPVRPKSPCQLSPSQSVPSDDVYDYATNDANELKGHGRSPRGSNSDVSEHSYKVLEQQEVYDYADVSDEEGLNSVSSAELPVYEDVDEASLRAASVKKHKSASDLPPAIYGYEEPITGHIRPQSSPMGKQAEATLQVKSDTNLNLVNKELKEKIKLNPVSNTGKNQKTESKGATPKQAIQPKQKVKTKDTPKSASKDVLSGQGNVVKCDNTETKDYEKPDMAKGVLRMAKMFENKTNSDSESDTQKSPRRPGIVTK